MRTRSAVVLALIAGLLAPPSGSAQEAPGWDGTSTMIGGTARYEAGEWIHQDFVYDDYGADTQRTGADQIVGLASTSGDFRYPTADRYGHNAADIAEVRVQVSDDDLLVRVTMNTLRAPGTTVIGLGLDEGAAEPRAWPLEAGVRSSWSRFVTVAEGVVHLTDGGGTSQVGSADVDLEANTIDFAVPGAASGGPVGLTLGSGLWDDADGVWLAGESGNEPSEDAYSTGGETDVRVFDLAFNLDPAFDDPAAEPRSANWMEDGQSEALAAGDVAAFTRIPDPAKLSEAVTEEDPEASASGFHDRLFRSRQDHLAEGVNPDDFPQFNGLHQTYGLWIPEGYDPDEPGPLLLLLHSLSVHHNQYAGGGGTESFATLYEQLAEGLDAVAVTPLARGPDGWYWDEGLVDTLEVWADVREHYAVDDDRTYSSGYSMGGYGTYRLGTLMPDRLAGAVSWVGPPAHTFWAYPLSPSPSGPRQGPGNTHDQLESLRHVPTYIVHGTNDELVPVTGVVHQAERLRELGYEHRLALHPGQDHLSFVYVDSWTRERDWLSGRERVSAPATVTFDVRPASWATPGDPVAPEVLADLAALGAELDSAYWVRDVAVASDAGTGVVELTSEAIADRVPETIDVDEVNPGITEEAPTTPYLLRGTDRALADAPVSDVLSGRLEGVTELTIDLDAAGLSDEPALDVAADRPVTIHFERGGSIVGSATVGG